MSDWKSIKGKWVPKGAVTPPVEPILPEAPKEEIKVEPKAEEPKRRSRGRREE